MTHSNILALRCANGQVNLPPLQTLPEPLHQLFVGRILQNLDVFETAFEVTIQLSHSHHLVLMRVFIPAGVYCFRVSSTVCHRIGHLQPNTDGEGAKFAHLYRSTCWTHCIHSTHCTTNNKRLSSPIHTH